MKRSFPVKVKQILPFILIIGGVILSGNTNNNPISFIERVFTPIKIGSATLYYANIFPILLIYYGFKGMNEYRPYKYFDTRTKRIIAMIIVLFLSAQLYNYGIKISKSMSQDLNSIYYNRDNTNNIVFFKQNDKDVRITCLIELENCSRKPQAFYMKLSLPKYYDKFIVLEELQAKENDLKTNKRFILCGKERKQIKATFLGHIRDDISGFSGGTKQFEFSLFNTADKVKFIEKR